MSDTGIERFHGVPPPQSHVPPHDEQGDDPSKWINHPNWTWLRDWVRAEIARGQQAPARPAERQPPEPTPPPSFASDAPTMAVLNAIPDQPYPNLEAIVAAARAQP